MKLTELKSQIRAIIKEELNRRQLNENQVTSIPKFNTESDFYISMLKVLKNDTKFETIVEKFGISIYQSQDDIKSKFNSFKNDLKSIMKGRLMSKTADDVLKMNPSRKNVEISHYIKNNLTDSNVLQLLISTLAHGVMFDLKEDPIGFSKRIGSDDLISAAKQFSINRGKAKLTTMLNNKGF